MKCVLSEQPYQWQDGNGKWKVGNLILDHDDNRFTRGDGALSATSVSTTDRVLVLPSGSHIPAFVEWGKLTAKPSQCDGGCKERGGCRGAVRRVRVENAAGQCRDLGEFNYCDEAIARDKGRGMRVMDPKTLDEVVG